MSAPTERVIIIMVLVLGISMCFLVPKAMAQSDKYPKMAPVDQSLMERNAEILLARSAAPDSISSNATILVLGRQGYETAVVRLPKSPDTIQSLTVANIRSGPTRFRSSPLRNSPDNRYTLLKSHDIALRQLV